MTAAALVTTVAFATPIASPAPPPDPINPVGPQTLSAAERTVRCKNNVHDDEKINRRIERSQEGDEIIFDGQCLIDAPIKLLGNRGYRGGSRTGTTITQADGANLDAMFASDSYLDNSSFTGRGVSLRAMTIDANGANNPNAHDAVVLRSWQTTLEDVQIENATRHGVRLTNLSANGTPLENTQVNGRLAQLQINDSGGSGIYVEDTGNSVTDWQLEDTYIAGTGGDGIHMDNAAGWMINGNHIYGVDGDHALYANRLFGTSIADNYIEGFSKIGILGLAQGSAASTVSGNRIFDFDGGPVDAYLRIQGNYDDPLVVVNGNAIEGEGNGIGLDYLKGNAVHMTVTSTGNLVTKVDVPLHVGEGVTVNGGTFAP